MSTSARKQLELEMGRGAEEIDGAVEYIHKLNRRQALKAAALAAGGLALAGTGLLPAKRTLADEGVKTGKFVFPRLQFTVLDNTPDIWNVHPIGDVNLRKKLQEMSNINVSQEPKVVRLADFDEMCRHPYVFMTSEGFFKLPDNEEKNLREFFERGGFVHADDCVYSRQDRFFVSYVKLLNKLFPDNPMRQIPNDHEIFHNYFDMPMWHGGISPCPHMQGVDHGAWGLFERERGES